MRIEVDLTEVIIRVGTIALLHFWRLGTRIAPYSTARTVVMLPRAGRQAMLSMTSIQRVGRTVASALVVTGTAGCHASPPATAADGERPIPAETVDDSARDVVRALCQREQRCGNIGISRQYETLDACTTLLGQRVRAEINGRDCTTIERATLRRCLQRITADGCEVPIDSVASVGGCEPVSLCGNTQGAEQAAQETHHSLTGDGHERCSGTSTGSRSCNAAF